MYPSFIFCPRGSLSGITMVHHSGSIQSFKQQKGMHTSISEILKEKTLKSSRRSLPCLAQSQTHPENLNHFLSVPLSPEPKTYSHSVSASCTHIIPPPTDTGQDVYMEEREAGDFAPKTHHVQQKPVSRGKLEARTESIQRNNLEKPPGLMFRDGKKRIDYILVYKKSSLQVEKRCTFERNLRAEGLMLEKETSGSPDPPQPSTPSAPLGFSFPLASQLYSLPPSLPGLPSPHLLLGPASQQLHLGPLPTLVPPLSVGLRVQPGHSAKAPPWCLSP